MMTTRKGLNQVGDYALIQCFKSLSVCDFLIFFVNGKMPQESTRIVTGDAAQWLACYTGGPVKKLRRV